DSSCRRDALARVRQRGKGLKSGGMIQTLASKAAKLLPASADVARHFFETHFTPVTVTEAGVEAKPYPGFLTGYFEPVVSASRTRSDAFPIPLYARPHDLIDVDDTNRSEKLPADYRFGRLLEGEIVPFFDRREINAGALDGRGLEMAFVNDLVTAFFIHVQGSGKLVFEDGSSQRITFAAKAGHPYTSLGKVLCDILQMDPSTMTADFLARWMRDNPNRLEDFLAHNRSYIFFEEENQSRPDQGPVAAAKLPLMAGRSLAVDRRLHTFGTPIWVMTKRPLPDNHKPLRRLMVAHDTGSIIQGVQRGDFFAGSGDEAGSIAGRMRNACSMVVLKPVSGAR
ncbi:MAG: MltA domain-containing protein, partial [Pseudomonadota bacterium]